MISTFTIQGCSPVNAASIHFGKLALLAGSGEGLWGLVSGVVNQLFGGDTKDSYISVKWPQLSATGGDIDEKMFKEVDFRDE